MHYETISCEMNISYQALSQNPRKILGVYINVMLSRPSYIKALMKHRPTYIARVLLNQSGARFANGVPKD